MAVKVHMRTEQIFGGGLHDFVTSIEETDEWTCGWDLFPFYKNKFDTQEPIGLWLITEIRLRGHEDPPIRMKVLKLQK